MATFLPKGKRIHLKLRKATLNRGGSTRQHNFKLELDLTEGDDVLTGLPEWMQNAFTNLAQIGNCAEEQKFDVVFNDHTLEFFGSGKAKQKLFPVVLKAKLSKFVMTRTGTEDEDVEVKLVFTALFDTTKQIHEWVFDDEDSELWMTAESPQLDLNLNGVQEKKEDKEEEDEIDAQQRRKEEAGARTTPLIPLVPRRTPASSPHN
jgi:hypothetical protein